jgi:hypothetical protein
VDKQLRLSLRPAETRGQRFARRAREVRNRAIKRSFGVWQRLGVHVVPNDFYEPVPDTRTLGAAHFTRRSAMVGVDLRVQAQLDLLHRFRARYKSEVDALPVAPVGQHPHFFHDNGVFGWIDAAVLYCVLREFRPQRVVEIGAGFSTLLTAQALRTNAADDGQAVGAAELVAVEPYPRQFLVDGAPGSWGLLRRPVQDVPPEEFERLEAGDVLFIDSSHVLKPGSDVAYEILEIIPRLAPGVLVHAHDIFLPAEYPERVVLGQRRFWTEQYLLHAFLAFNSDFEVLFATSFLHLEHPDELERSFACYERNSGIPGSFWFRRTPVAA